MLKLSIGKNLPYMWKFSRAKYFDYKNFMSGNFMVRIQGTHESSYPRNLCGASISVGLCLNATTNIKLP